MWFKPAVEPEHQDEPLTAFARLVVGAAHETGMTPGLAAVIQALHGEVAASQFWAGRAYPDVERWPLLILRALHALDALDWAEFDAAIAEMPAQGRHQPGLGPVLAVLLGYAALARGGRRRALRRLESELELLEPPSDVRPVLERLQVQLLVSQGEINGALALASGGSSVGVVERARVLLASGRFSRARQLLESTERFEFAPLRERVALRLLGAAACARLGQGEQARQLLREAIVQMGPVETAAYMLATCDHATLSAASSHDPLLSAARERRERSLAIDVFAYPPASVGGARLTPREHTVLQHLASDLAMKEVAQRLVVSTNTLNAQVRSIYRKLGVNSRLAAVHAATAQGLIDAAKDGVRSG